MGLYAESPLSSAAPHNNLGLIPVDVMGYTWFKHAPFSESTLAIFINYEVHFG